MKKEKGLRIIFGIVAFGCIWGFLEAITFLGALHSHWGDLFSYHLCPCFLMAAVFGSFVMGSALAIYKRPSMLIGIGLVAAAFCWLAVPFLPSAARTTFYGPVVASSAACLAGSICLAMVASLLMKALEKASLPRLGVGGLSAILASIPFILVTSYGWDKAICSDLGYTRPLPDFLGIGGLVWMFLASILFPLGYLVGAKVRAWLAARAQRRPSLSYAGSSAVIALCCGIGSVAFMIGL